MAASETAGLIANRDSFISSPAMQTVPAPAPAVVQTLHLGYNSDGTAVYKQVSTSPPPYQVAPAAGEGSAEGSSYAIVVHNLNENPGSDSSKRKRGRPRKYGPDGTMAAAMAPGLPKPTSATATLPGGSFSPPVPPPSASAPPPHVTPSSPSSSARKARGRPPGSSSRKQQMEAMGSTGSGFTPHIITVRAGEDVSAKIMSFSQSGPRAVCIMSAIGTVSNVTLRQTATSGGTATYEGRFEILSLSGSFLLSEVGGQRSRSGGLSVTLAGPDGRVLGGSVAGLLIAAAPIQIVAGSFMSSGPKEPQPVNHVEHFSVPFNVNPVGAAGTSSPPSRGTLSESSGGPGSPFNQSTAGYNNVNNQGMSSMPWK